MSIEHDNFDYVTSLENLFFSWRIFRLGKARKKDVIEFERHIEDNVFALHRDLVHGLYVHGAYERFLAYDTKKRNIYKARVRDRVVHLAVYQYLVGIYEPIFISDSYASRLGKGTHRAVKTLRYFMSLAGGRKRQVWVLKGDIRKYFENVDHRVLFELIRRQVSDRCLLALIQEIVSSFETLPLSKRGLPLGNVTSQILANVYLHELDIFVKRKLGVRFYVRYNDDFVLVNESEARLKFWQGRVQAYLARRLKLEVPSEKVELRKVSQGIDFLGYVVSPDFILLRNQTKGKVVTSFSEKSFSSYMGILSHAHSYSLRQKLLADFYLKQERSLI